MRTVWIWSGIWKLIACAIGAVILSVAIGRYFDLSNSMRALVGILLGAPVGWFGPEIWPCFRFEFNGWDDK